MSKISVLQRRLESIKKEFDLDDLESSFYYITLQYFTKFLEYNDSEDIETYITDTKFNNKIGNDKGIDIFYPDNVNKEIHLFSCKYSYNKLDRTFPSNEISKIMDFIQMIAYIDDELISKVSPKMQELIKQAYDIMNNNEDYCIIIHLCSNYINRMNFNEMEEFKQKLKIYLGISYRIEEHTLDSYVNSIISTNYTKVNAKFIMTNNKYFEKSDGDIRALILSIKAIDMIRLILNDVSIRDDIQKENTREMLDVGLIEDIFYDNVRQYKGEKNKINKSIKETAQSDSSSLFFYYNNGITMTCSKFKYSKNISNPNVVLENMQIVNGSQTLHTLFDVGKENIENLYNIELLCRIYEIDDEKISTKIAEYTNSQSSVTTRDLKALDNIQKDLDSEAQDMGYFYERKKDMYKNEDNEKRIDAEKVGQSLFAFYNKNPHDAKNNKNKIFSIYYDTIFNEEINFSKVLLCHRLYKFIDNQKKKISKEIRKNKDLYVEKAHILYSTYYFLYLMRIFAENNDIDIYNENSYNEIIKYYDEVEEIIYQAVIEEKTEEKKYTTADFFKSTKVKIRIDNILKNLNYNF